MLRVVITGANCGVGLGLVQQLCRARHEVIATCRNPASAGELSALAQSMENVLVLPMDVTNADSLAQAASLNYDGAAILV